MPLRVAEKDGFIFAVNKCDECPSCFRMLSGVKAHLSDNKPSGFGCFHDKITTRENIGRDTRLDAIPVWCPLPAPGSRFIKAPPLKAT